MITADDCILGRTSCTGCDCYTCGFNRKVAEKRKQKIRSGGMTRLEDGSLKLIIKQQGGDI